MFDQFQELKTGGICWNKVQAFFQNRIMNHFEKIEM